MAVRLMHLLNQRSFALLCWLPLFFTNQGILASDMDTPLLASGGSYLQQQRNHYMAAKAALAKGRLKTYRQHYDKLADYPLKPYLKYSELQRRLHLLPYEEVDEFLQLHEHSYLEQQLRKEWLRTLAKRKHWHDYQSYYKTGLNNTELHCLYLQARINTGEENVFKEVAEVWNVGRSQPDICDPVFNAWMKAGYLTTELVWQRHSKALKERGRSLAHYISGLMPAKQRKLAELYQEVDRFPERIRQRARFREQTPEMQDIIQHGIHRFAYRDAAAALGEWQRYDAQQLFSDQAREETHQHLITQLARQGHRQTAEQLLSETQKAASDDELIGWMVRDALRNQEWPRVYQWLKQLPAPSQQTERWLYWRARSMEQLNVKDPAFPTPEQIYASLALTRNFYGFLSADRLGRDYTVVDNPVKPPQELVTAVASLPGVKRARELYELNDRHHARLEWYYATRPLDTPALLASAKLAETWGWYQKSIQAMIAAQQWDDLELRFPLAYKDQMHAAAEKTDATPTLLFAIARQESAFAADARSPAGALGLMQLMPGTAKQTARRVGMRYQYHDLLKPEPNISLGSQYLHQLLEQFNGNRILATAAYNAGPHRVKQWLASSDKRLPYDIWIETIPFKETRGYVQNVLAYSVIYGYRMGTTAPMITPEEAKNPL